MFGNFGKQFDGIFGKPSEGFLRLTMNGKIAVRCSDGKYKKPTMSKREH